MSQEDVQKLNKKFRGNRYLQEDSIKEVRIYNGLIYFAMEVSKYETATKQISTTEKNKKHYCQEAETLASILYNLSKLLYKDAKIKGSCLYFKDDNNNQCKINFKYLIIPAELSHDGEYKEDALKKFAAIKTIEELKRLVYEQDLNLQFCHAPIFTSITPDKDDSYVPVMVQSGDSGEGIIRDSDFEHFYKHPLIPSVAHKSFNAAQQFRPECNRDHLDGLYLLILRLNAVNLKNFEAQLDQFVSKYIDSRMFLRSRDIINLDDYTISELKKLYPEKNRVL